MKPKHARLNETTTHNHALRQTMTPKQFREFWKTVPEPESKFFRTMVVMQTAMGLTDLHYRLIPPEIGKQLRRCDANTLFSIVADCVGILSRTLAMQRVREVHRANIPAGLSSARPAWGHAGSDQAG